MVVKQKYIKKVDYLSSDKDTIKSIQKMLRDFNLYDGEIDGEFGQATYSAVKVFQEYYKQYEHTQEHEYKVPLLVDGQIGKQTILAMDEAAVNNWKYKDPETEIIYDIKNKKMILLSGDNLKLFETEEKLVNDVLSPLSQVRNSKGTVSQDEIKESKEKVQKLLQDIKIDDIGTSSLTEVRRLKGKKFTYIRSEHMANHIRSYSMAVEDRDRSTLRTNGSFDAQKIKQAFASKLDEAKIKVSYELFPEELKELTNWANTFAGEHSWEFRDKDIENKQWDASASATWLRFSAGASMKATPSLKDLRNGNLAFSLESNSEIALAKGEIKAIGYLPYENGYHIKIPNKGRDGSAKKDISLGHIRADLESNAQGFAGANAMLAVDVGFKLDNNDGKLSIEKPEAKGKIDLFAGVKVSCGIKASLQWKNPEAGYKFSLLAAIGYGGSASLGIGLEGELTIDFNGDTGKFIIRAKAGVICGVGASGEIGFEVNAKTILNLVQFVYHTLMNDNYTYMEFITDKAFKALTVFIFKVVDEGLEKIEELYDIFFDTYKEFWIEYFPDLSNERELAKEIVLGKHNTMLKVATPEAKGFLISYLAKTSVTRTEETQEQAIINILYFIQSRKEARNVFKSISLTGGKVSEKLGEKVIHDILDDYKIRTGVLNHGYQGEKHFDKWWDNLPEEPKRKGSPIVAFNDVKFNIYEENPIYYA